MKLLRNIAHFISFAWKQVGVRDGKPRDASLSLKLDRLKVCHACPHYAQKTEMCLQCYCFVPIKTSFLDAECPENKWPLPR
jgi:hypothetical protein